MNRHVPSNSHEAWIDVGGTFTDCFVRHPGETLLRGKTLSSGMVPVSGAPVEGDSKWLLEELRQDCPKFWEGARLVAMDAAGQVIWCRVIDAFADGYVRLGRSDAPLGLTGNVKSNLMDKCDASTAGRQQSGIRLEVEPGVEAPVLGVHRLLQIPLADLLPPLRVRLGTTRGTNALLTRTGASTALAITAPFRDLLAIGDQTRPDLFALHIERTRPLATHLIEIDQRLDADGNVLTALDETGVAEQLRQALAEGCESLAICLMHSYLNPVHEEIVAGIAQRIGFQHVSVSSDLAPVIELVARTQTTVVDAYLGPVVRSYLAKLVEQFGGREHVRMQVMTSAGGLDAWYDYSGKDCILSGPAGGVAALYGIADCTSSSALIGLDMGGTSTDVCRVAEDQGVEYESTKAGVRILTPTLPIETVASGGGSLCWFDGVSLRVGPQSAGASPGPACYGRGGPLTVTDINVFLGYIPPRQFPFCLDLQAIEKRLDEMLRPSAATLRLTTRRSLAAGFRTIANELMADAVRTVSQAQGIDPRSHTLIGFGGAAGQHICDIADLLQIESILDAADGGLLSALGMGLAPQREDAVLPVYLSIEHCDWSQIEQDIAHETERLRADLADKTERAEAARPISLLELRYVGTDTSLTIDWVSAEQIAGAFAAAYRQRFGYARESVAIELVAVRLSLQLDSDYRLDTVTSVAERLGYRGRGDHPLVLLRQQLVPGDRVIGPATICNVGSTLAIPESWTAESLSDGTLQIIKATSSAQAAWSDEAMRDTAVATHCDSSHEHDQDFDPVFRDCFAQRLTAIATQMGLVLQQTAVSVNVKQRRDFSCAVFDRDGRLLASAPHVPVHLGAMGETVRAVHEQFPCMRPGDSFITNDPYQGGSHLPDVTVITPVFVDQAESESPPQMFIANRAHHADVGGLTPGSMSVDSKKLSDEGVIITPRRLTEVGESRFDELETLLKQAPLPPRNVGENLEDISAQLAANSRGVRLLRELADVEGWEKLARYAEHLLEVAEQRVRQFLRAARTGYDQSDTSQATSLLTGMRSFHDFLDDGTRIEVSLDVRADGSLQIDFSGSGATHPGNFNANRSIVTAAVMYVVRCLIADELPLNEGVMRCIDLHIPIGLLNPQPAGEPGDSPAVAAGNVETSQRVVDVLLGAFGAAAASQGTMNNLLFGNSRFGFYETICGGAGAIAGHGGASGVHTHMTNTRLTDPEVLEKRYPVRLNAFRLREDSGGRGRWKGGEGVVRCVEFLEPVSVSLLTSRRHEPPPFGLAGGGPGGLGRNYLIRSTGQRLVLDACCQLDCEAGDQIELLTPGGGGWGEPENDQPN